METLHVKYEFDEALASKKDTLNTEINLIDIVKKIQAYKILRKKELDKKEDIRKKINELATKINSTRKSLPKANIPKVDEQEIEENVEEIKKNVSLEEELEDIKKKLASLA